MLRCPGNAGIQHPRHIGGTGAFTDIVQIKKDLLEGTALGFVHGTAMYRPEVGQVILAVELLLKLPVVIQLFHVSPRLIPVFGNQHMFVSQ